MLKFRYHDTVIELHFLFVAVVTLCFLLDRSGGAIIALLVAMIHEAGHLIALMMMGYAPRRLSFDLFGVRLEKQTDQISLGKEVIILLAGCGVNLLIFVMLVHLEGGIQRIGLFAGMNLVIGVLNLFPMRGFDGGQLMELFLLQVCLPHTATRLLRALQVLILLAITAYAIYYFLYCFPNITLLLVCCYLWGSLLSNSASFAC